MPSTRRPQKWLCVAAFAAAFWITLRVVAAPVPPRLTTSASDPSLLVSQASPYEEIRDPALERFIADLAETARGTRR